MTEIKVKKRENNGGTFFDVMIGGVTILGCRRMKGTGDKGPYDFVSLPQQKYQKDGKDKYARIVELDKETEEAVRDAVIACDEGTDKGGDVPTEDTELETF